MKIHITSIVIVVLLALSGAAHGQTKNAKPQTYTLVNHAGKIELWVGSNSFGRFANVSF